MKLAIVGSRNFTDYNLVNNTIKNLLCPLNYITCIVSGEAKGADFLAKRFAENQGISYIEYLAAWYKYGKSAGFLRNQTIIDNCDMVLAFWDGKSRGTADTIKRAKKAKKPTFIVYY